MATFSLLDVDIIQSILRSSGIVSAVTGDVGMSYHGVDVVTHVGKADENAMGVQQLTSSGSRNLHTCCPQRRSYTRIGRNSTVVYPP